MTVRNSWGIKKTFMLSWVKVFTNPTRFTQERANKYLIALARGGEK